MWFLERLKLVKALGVTNVLRVASYRARLRLGIHPVQKVTTETPAGPFFPSLASERAEEGAGSSLPPPEFLALGWIPVAIDGAPPDWFRYLSSGGQFEPRDMPWWAIPDFNPGGGDIKEVWELSRMDWVPLAVARALDGDAEAAPTLERWLADWVEKNPPSVGPNWKCGQEASIRVLHLAMASLLRPGSPPCGSGLASLLRLHLGRIAPVTGYARGQDNNHATSEAAALFVGGSWLERCGHSEGSRWERQGRALLDRLVPRLVEVDGSFSQHSVTYHRLMLDTLSITEVWRRRLELRPFSDAFQSRASAASAWLRAMVVPGAEGDFPNLGANDGANLLAGLAPRYRDLRPSVELATRLFLNGTAFPQEGGPAEALGISAPARPLGEPESSIFEHGGYAVLREKGAMAVLRFPRARFRPGQSDALHVDLWAAGENLLRDGGSYSYAAEPALQDRFAGPEGHCTAQFDGRDPMPRIGPFLRKDWLDTAFVQWEAGNEGKKRVRADVRDRSGALHQREVELQPGELTVRDSLSGFRERALLRWRLRPGPWEFSGPLSVSDGKHTLRVETTHGLRRIEFRTGLESRYYLQMNELPVLEVELSEPGEIVTRYRWR
ncbi:MAG: heparinase [Gemmatimonadales bacterium]|nr:MAG: heparinase [Gemmatimonadales bacterium]